MRYSKRYSTEKTNRIFMLFLNKIKNHFRFPRLSNLRYQCIYDRESALEISDAQRQSYRPDFPGTTLRNSPSHPNSQNSPLPCGPFPKDTPFPVSSCISLPCVLVSPCSCQPNDTTLTGRSGKQLSGRPYGGCTCGHACVRRILLFPPVCQPTYSCHPPFDSGGCRPSNGSNSC